MPLQLRASRSSDAPARPMSTRNGRDDVPSGSEKPDNPKPTTSSKPAKPSKTAKSPPRSTKASTTSSSKPVKTTKKQTKPPTRQAKPRSKAGHAVVAASPGKDKPSPSAPSMENASTAPQSTPDEPPQSRAHDAATPASSGAPASMTDADKPVVEGGRVHSERTGKEHKPSSVQKIVPRRSPRSGITAVARPAPRSSGPKPRSSAPQVMKPRVTSPQKSARVNTPMSAPDTEVPAVRPRDGGSARKNVTVSGGIAQYFENKPSSARASRSKKQKGGDKKAVVTSTKTGSKASKNVKGPAVPSEDADDVGAVRRKLDLGVDIDDEEPQEGGTAAKREHGVDSGEKGSGEKGSGDAEHDEDEVQNVSDVQPGSEVQKNNVNGQKKSSGWSQQSDSSAFMTPPHPPSDPPFTNKRKATYGSFVQSMKKRKKEADAQKKETEADAQKKETDAQKKSKSSGKGTGKKGKGKRSVKPDPDTASAVKTEACDEELQIMPTGNMKPKDHYLYLMRQWVPHVEIAFNDLAAARSTAIAYLSEFEAMFVDNELSVEDFTVMFEKILFVRMPEELKEKWATPEGKQASQLRRTVMRSCLQMARINLFDDFATRSADDADNGDLLFDENGRPVLPLWLTMADTDRKSNSKIKKTKVKKGVGKKEAEIKYSINSKSVNDAVKHNETCKQPKSDFNYRKRIVKRNYPKRSEMAHYALNYLYHALLTVFTRTRRPAKLTFFVSLGYLFMHWSEHDDCEVKNSPVHLRWAAPMRDTVLNTWDPDRIASSVTYKASSSSMDNGNLEAYNSFGRATDDVVLLVSHDVIVRDVSAGGSQRKRKGNERRVWHKAINLIDVVRRVLEQLCGFLPGHPMYDILRAHEYSIPVLYTLARTLRKILSLLPGRTIADGPPENDDDDVTDDGDDGGNAEGNGEDPSQPEGSDEGDQGDDGDGGDGADGDGNAADDGQDADCLHPRNAVDGETDTGVATGSTVADDGTGDARVANAMDAAGNDGDDDAEGNVGRESKIGKGAAERLSSANNGSGDADTASAAEREDGEEVGGDAAGSGAGQDGDVPTNGDGEENGAEDTEAEAALAAKFMALFMTDEIANSVQLRQATCCVEDHVYWAEQIKEDNEDTARFAHINIGALQVISDDSVCASEEDDEDAESASEEEDNFGFS